MTPSSDITEVLTYTASVEKYENGAWAATTELTPSQEAQLQWHFIKNNDEGDKDILTDNPTNDTVVVNGLEMSITVQPDNIYKHGHAHCFVVDADVEGYAVTELKRYIEVEDILTEILDNDTKRFEAQAIYNVDEITEEEKAMTKWTVEDTDVSEAKGKETMIYTFEGDKLELLITACIETSQMDVATASVSFALSEKEINGEKEANE